jgi:hypothetical protein
VPKTANGPEGGWIASDGVRVYGLSNDASSRTCVAAALDPWSGRVLSQSTLPAFSFAPPAIARDAVAVPGSDGTLRLLEPATGALQAELPLCEPSSGARASPSAWCSWAPGPGRSCPATRSSHSRAERGGWPAVRRPPSS